LKGGSIYRDWYWQPASIAIVFHLGPHDPAWRNLAPPQHCPSEPRRKRKRPIGRPKRKSRRLGRSGGYEDPAAGNQRDFNDVDWRENYLLLLITHPRYQPKRSRH